MNQNKHSNGREGRLRGKTIAILATDGFEEVELKDPREALEKEGARTILIAPKDTAKDGWIQGFRHHDKADPFPVDMTLDDANVDELDALLLPGGALNPDQLRSIPEAVALVRAFAQKGKPIAAICHGPWLLVEADIVRGKTVTSWPSIKTDLKNAGAAWVDREVVNDRGLVTSRKPDDIPAFVAEVIDVVAEGRLQPTAASPS